MSMAALVLAIALSATTASAGLPLHPRGSTGDGAGDGARDSAPRSAPVLARLAGPPPAAAEANASRDLLSRGGGPFTPQERDRRNAVVEALLDAEAQATESPETAVPLLQAALSNMADVAPLVADDEYAQTARVYAQLALARTHLVLEQPQQAALAIDEALRTSRGQPLPAAQFGPALLALHDARVAALAERAPAELAVQCVAACRVLVDEAPFDIATPALPAGPHRVWIEAITPGLPVLRRELELAPGERVELPYEVNEPEPEPEPPTLPPESTAPRRILPRWASALGLGLGVGAAGTGGALVAVDHRCPDLSDPRANPCLRILNTDAGGFALIGIGSAVAIAAAVIVAVDEVRAKRARAR